MSKIPVLIDTIMRLQRKTQAAVAKKAELHHSNLSRFLSGHIDMRMSSLNAILKTLNIHLEEILEKEVKRLLGQKGDAETLGEAVEALLRRTDPLTAKTILETLLARNRSSDSFSKSAISIVKDYKNNLRILRRA